MLTRLSLRLRIFLFFAVIALGGSALVITGLVIGYIRLGETHALNAFVIAGLVGVLAIGGLTTWVWVLFDEHVARPLERLAADLRARAHAAVERGESLLEDVVGRIRESAVDVAERAQGALERVRHRFLGRPLDSVPNALGEARAKTHVLPNDVPYGDADKADVSGLPLRLAFAVRPFDKAFLGQAGDRI